MRRYLVALVASAVIVGGLFAFDAVMRTRIDFYLTHGVEIPLYERILIGVAGFWHNSWWLLVPLISIACFGLAGLVHLCQHISSGSNR